MLGYGYVPEYAACNLNVGQSMTETELIHEGWRVWRATSMMPGSPVKVAYPKRGESYKDCAKRTRLPAYRAHADDFMLPDGSLSLTV